MFIWSLPDHQIRLHLMSNEPQQQSNILQSLFPHLKTFVLNLLALTKPRKLFGSIVDWAVKVVISLSTIRMSRCRKIPRVFTIFTSTTACWTCKTATSWSNFLLKTRLSWQQFLYSFCFNSLKLRQQTGYMRRHVVTRGQLDELQLSRNHRQITRFDIIF